MDALNNQNNIEPSYLYYSISKQVWFVPITYYSRNKAHWKKTARKLLSTYFNDLQNTSCLYWEASSIYKKWFQRHNPIAVGNVNLRSSDTCHANSYNLSTSMVHFSDAEQSLGLSLSVPTDHCSQWCGGAEKGIYTTESMVNGLRWRIQGCVKQSLIRPKKILPSYDKLGFLCSRSLVTKT